MYIALSAVSSALFRLSFLFLLHNFIQIRRPIQLRQHSLIFLARVFDIFAENGGNKDVCAALSKSGFAERLAALPQGLETNLTSEFEDDGINLSGGEGQKLAIARVFYTGANLIILDEPSSALDPIAEYHLNCSMLTAAENKSVLFISHRLSTTRIADRIYMLEGGKIIEEGSHAELLENDAKYAEMWRVQAGQYVLS